MTAVPTPADADPAGRRPRPTSALIAAGTALMVPLVLTVFMMVAETGPGTVAGTYALLAAEHLVALAGAVALIVIGRRVGRPVRGLGLTAVVASVVPIAAQFVLQVSDPNIGSGALWMVSAAVLALTGGLAVASARRR